MSLLTRCPACTTLYRVVPDQLRISEGWVKCGQCGDIFDASRDLFEAECAPEPEPQLPEQAEAQTVVVQTDPEISSFISAEPDTTVVGNNEQDPLEYQTDSELSMVLQNCFAVPIEPEPTFTDVIQASEVEEPSASDWSTSKDGLPEPEHVPHPDPTSFRWDDDPLGQSLSATPTSHTTVPEEVSFLQGKKGRSGEFRPLVRRVLVLVTLMLGLALPMQWVYFEHDRLAAQLPALKDALQVFCGLAQCSIKPLMRIDALSVDSVGFNKLGKEGYRLTFSIKNSHSLALAFPSVELTLTDAQDQPVFRRVFSSLELGAENAVIGAGSEWPVTVGLRVNSGMLAQPVSGYRLLVFYP